MDPSLSSQRMTLIAVTLFVFSCNSALAKCWQATDFKGQSTRAAESYNTSSDGYSGKTFQVVINEDSGSISPSDLACKPTTSNSLICVAIEGQRMVVETWTVDEAAKKVVHTKAISGYGRYDGGNLFVGRLVDRCKSK